MGVVRAGARRQRRPGVIPAAVAGIGAAFFVLPLIGLLYRAPWSDLGRHWRAASGGTALRLSLQCSLLATLVSLVLGLPLAWILARHRFPGRSLLRALTTLPMVLPPVVGGVALLSVFGRRGVLGRWLLDVFGIRLPFTTAGAVVAEAFVAMPFLVLTAEAAFRAGDRRFEEAAATLGATRFVVFRRVTLPLVAPALVAGAVLTWARALGEFGATITFAGNTAGQTTTLPLAAYDLLNGSEPDGAIVISLVLLVVSLAVLVALRDRWIGAGGGGGAAGGEPVPAWRSSVARRAGR